MDQIDLENNSWRDKVVSLAFSYANYEWLPTNNNIRHGYDRDCWGLTKRLSTKSIPEIATELDILESLLPGDVILKPGSHVMIFINYEDGEKTRAQIVDANRSTGRVLLRTVVLEELFQKGYKGYRRNMV